MSCLDQYDCEEEQCVLLSEIGTEIKEYFITSKKFKTYQQQWQDYADSREAIHTPVYAYNYEWDAILEMVNKKSSLPGIWIKYGLRTLSPSDNYDFGKDEGEKIEGYSITGSIVYCNIAYGDNPDNSTKEFFNFAKPCPRYCN
ncbi:MAG: hypothetical protein JKY02_02440 [Flavobacteriaceae bacterium]|nr:hypothetical protein [Flavobacteriaceae bacterium]